MPLVGLLGLKYLKYCFIAEGCYYLVDAGYCNSSGFLAPYRGHRYHLNEFDGHRPETPEEYFNMKHSRARNVIESMMKSSTVDVHNQETNDVEYGRGKNKRFWTEEESWIHKDAKGLYNVSFSYFTDLDIVYGKDRATGDVAEDPLAAEQNLGNIDVTLTVTDESDSNIEIEFLSTMESLPSNSSSSCAAKKKCPHQVHKASKKTKFAPVKNAETEYKEFNDEIRGFMKSLDGHLSTMSTWMQGTTSRMPQVLELLEKHGFSGPDKYKAFKAICQDPLNVDLLFSLDSTEVREYVLTLI
ncbi:hypothetical protein ZIOFF_065779 [Zingiber officinale]|uniref:DDE Tnp4 domain-containing protein n=1 Tax=Zingiber officinale TaxID=94328 RepID=A0A8J5KHD3_ZINOF|nr:hypothetical protein ZIOFF_065779 [Zingiber officinale]